MRSSSRDFSNSGEPFEDRGEAAAGFAGAHHVDVEVGEIVGMGGEAFGQRFAAFEDAEDVGDDGAEGCALGEFGSDAERAVHRNAGGEERREFLGEVRGRRCACLPPENGHFENELLLLLEADEDGRQSLAAEFARDKLVGLGGEGAGADFAVGGDGAELEGRHAETPKTFRPRMNANEHE